MVTKNLQQFNQQLHARQPLFMIETVLSAPEIVLSPPANEIYKLIMQSVRDMVEGYVAEITYSVVKMMVDWVQELLCIVGTLGARDISCSV